MSFDVTFYKNNNKDLYFDNDYMYYIHWLKNGIYENKKPNKIDDNLIFYKPDEQKVLNFFNNKKKKFKYFLDKNFISNIYNNDIINNNNINNFFKKGLITNSLVYNILFPFSIIKHDINNNFFIYYKNIKYELTNFTNKYFTNDIIYI